MMENLSVLNNTGFINDKTNEAKINRKKNYRGTAVLSPSFVNTVSGGISKFLSFLKNPGQSDDPDLMILCSSNQYYDKKNDSMSFRTSANLKKLNHINNLDKFLADLVRTSPPEASFVGYFSDSKTLNGNGRLSHQPSMQSKRSSNLLDPGTSLYPDKNEVLAILEKYGFKIIEAKEMSGLTYFYSENIRRKAELRKAS
jgi:hypothetical protein